MMEPNENDLIVQAVRESIEIERNRMPDVYGEDQSDDVEINFNTDTSLRFADGITVEPETVRTSLGDVKVFVVGDESKPPVIAFCDIGTTYETSLKGFLNYPGNKENFAARACVYVVEMVGQSYDSADIDVNQLVMADYVSVIESVKEEYNIKRFLGLGVGIGGLGLLHYALAYPETLRGLILFSCPAHKCGWLEWFDKQSVANTLKTGTFSNTAKEKLINRYFSPELIDSEKDIVTFYQNSFSRLNPANLGKLLQAYLSRPSISASIPSLNIPSLLFIGKKSSSYSDYLDLNTLLIGSECIEVKSADLIPVGHPEVTPEAIDSFLYTVNM